MRTGICLTLLLVLGWQGQDWLRAEQASVPENYVVAKGTRIPLVMVNSVSTKTSRVGDRVYLQTSFPIAANGRIVKEVCKATATRMNVVFSNMCCQLSRTASHPSIRSQPG